MRFQEKMVSKRNTTSCYLLGTGFACGDDELCEDCEDNGMKDKKTKEVSRMNDFDFYKKGQAKGCVWTYADCKDCPFDVCVSENKQRAFSLFRRKLISYLSEMRLKPRSIALLISLRPARVRRILWEMKDETHTD